MNKNSSSSETYIPVMKLLWNFCVGVGGAVVGCVGLSIILSEAFGSVNTSIGMSHYFQPFPWLFAVSVVPAGLGGILLGRLGEPNWLLAGMVAFIVVVLSASFGACIVQGMRVGYHRVNVPGAFIACWVYATVLLPITTPLAYIVSKQTWRRGVIIEEGRIVQKKERGD